ncbi:hypothetical protein Tco_0098832 [Tanacetum coccineum]
MFLKLSNEEGKPIDDYVLKMKGYVEKLERLGYVLPQDITVGLILNGLTKDFVGFVRNYNMHNMGRTIGSKEAKSRRFYLSWAMVFSAQVEAMDVLTLFYLMALNVLTAAQDGAVIKLIRDDESFDIANLVYTGKMDKSNLSIIMIEYDRRSLRLSESSVFCLQDIRKLTLTLVEFSRSTHASITFSDSGVRSIIIVDKPELRLEVFRENMSRLRSVVVIMEAL